MSSAWTRRSPPRTWTWLCLLPSVLLAAGAIAQDGLEARIQQALERARQPLLQLLADPLVQGRPGELALLCLAALHDGVPLDDPVLVKALALLAKAKVDDTYTLALRLLVAEAHPGWQRPAKLSADDTKALLKNRRDGAFGYRPKPTAWDLSNTQYAALGLRAAASLGIDVPIKAWTELAAAIQPAQQQDGGFRYRPGEGTATASMTAAGICVLAIARERLSVGGQPVVLPERSMRQAWGWLQRHKQAIGDPAQLWSFYFHYGLERAAILDDVVELDGVDWYRVGASMFVDRQEPAGHWIATQGAMLVDGKPKASPVDTAFAVLFLRRRFPKVAGPLTGPRGR